MSVIKSKIKVIIDNCWVLTDRFNYETILENNTKPFELEKPFFIDDAVNKSYKLDNEKWTHSEYIKRLKKKIIIEPNYSYCIVDFNKIIGLSAFYPNLVPSFPRYLLNLVFKRRKHFDKAILFDGQVGCNYFHFFSDIINKIWLVQKIENHFNIPIIIGEKTYKTKYFQFLLKNSDIKRYNWIVQEAHEYINVDELVFIRPMPYKREYFEKIKKIIIEKDSVDNRRIFLNRSKSTGRYIENFYEIEPILKKYNFEIIDTNNTTLDFQANLFNSIQFLVSIHGAGETNIIFSKKDLRFLEINPANRIACQYYWLSKELQLDYYDVILGDRLPMTNTYPEGGFYLEPKKLDDAINRMINHSQ